MGQFVYTKHEICSNVLKSCGNPYLLYSRAREQTISGGSRPHIDCDDAHESQDAAEAVAAERNSLTAGEFHMWFNIVILHSIWKAAPGTAMHQSR